MICRILLVMARKRADDSWYAEPKAPEVCVLCGREAPKLTDHHLVPKLRVAARA